MEECDNGQVRILWLVSVWSRDPMVSCDWSGLWREMGVKTYLTHLQHEEDVDIVDVRGIH